MHNGHLRRLVLTALLLFAGIHTGGCGLTLLSWERETALGVAAMPGMVEEFGGEVPDARLRGYLDRVGNSLLQGIEPDVPSDLPWEFTLLDSPVINAFALPGGKVFMTRGLCERLGSEAEFAAVVGHEIGHVTARHGNKRISNQIGLNLVLASIQLLADQTEEESDTRAVADAGMPLLMIGGNVVLLKFGRDEELEADALGVNYMVQQGYDPAGALRVQEVLRDASAGASRPPEILSTHPASSTRIDRINELIATTYAHTQNNSAYQLYEQRYRREFLTRLSTLPKHPQDRGMGRFALAHTSTWCAHCADD